jgi:hypothetical protein
MAPLLAARRQHFAAAFRLHPHAKAVRFSPAALARLICALWQSNPPLVPELVSYFDDSARALRIQVLSGCGTLHRPRQRLNSNSLVYSTAAHMVKKSVAVAALFSAWCASRLHTLSTPRNETLILRV